MEVGLVVFFICPNTAYNLGLPCCTLQVYLEIGVCNNGTQTTRGLGDKAYCTNPDQLGRVVIGDFDRLSYTVAPPFLAVSSTSDLGSTVLVPYTAVSLISTSDTSDVQKDKIVQADGLPPRNALK